MADMLFFQHTEQQLRQTEYRRISERRSFTLQKSTFYPMKCPLLEHERASFTTALSDCCFAEYGDAPY